MPDLVSQLEHLADIPLYKEEKPYVVLVAADKDDDSHELHNIRMETHENILFTDIRPQMKYYTIDTCGFEIVPHDMTSLELANPQQVATYKTETAQFLQRHFKAAYVQCYEARLRRNLPFVERAVDLNDAMLTERKAAGAHIDVTMKSGPDQIMHHLPEDAKAKYLKAGYRFRFVK
ncbi:hypothetical protein VE03_07902 [Pseudogymnoascus sp. 23342-1-I1]|nr:hypothetical protein VE03_07902 [Pseudogymnoascus sp. 23342-1-I1]